MFRFTRWIMQLQSDATGKREFAFILFVYSMVLTIWITPGLDADARKSILETWIYVAILFCALAFGAEVIVKAYLKRVSGDKDG